MLSKLRRLTTKLKKPSRLNVFSALASLLLSGALSVGGALTYHDSSKIALLISFAVYFFPIFFTSRILMRYLGKFERKRRKKKKLENFCFKRFFILLAIITIPYLIVFLAYFPGLFAFDVDTQLMPNPITSHHPIVHTLALHGLLHIGHAFHLGDNSIIALMTLVQIGLCSVVYAYISEYIWRISNQKTGIFAAIFFGFFPVCTFGAISITKDTSHAFFTVLLLTKVHQFITSKNARIRDVLFLGATTSLYCLSRNNAPFIIALWLIPLFFLLKKHSKRILVTMTLLVSLVSSIAVDRGLNAVFQTFTLSESAAFSVPLQIIAGVVDRHPDLMPERNKGGRLLDFFEVGENYYFGYNPINADTAKFTYGEQITKDNKISFLSTAGTVVIKYPKDSLITFLTLNKSSWYPFSFDYGNFYRGYPHFNETRFGASKLLPSAHESTMLPKIKAILDYELREMNYTKNPILTLLLAPASYVLALVFCIIYLIYSRRYSGLYLPVFILAGFFITLIAAPGILLRYIAPVMITTPILYIFTFSEKNSKKRPAGSRRQ